MKLGVLFSGGKDSVYATYLAMQKEEVSCLISLVSENDESYMFHTPNIHLTSLQAEAMGIPILEYTTQGIEEEELEDLKQAIARAVEQYDIEGIVTGAVLSVYQATRIQKICDALGLWCYNPPLWHIDQDWYMQTLIDEGFVVIVSGVFSAPFDETWLGRRIDHEALRLLRLYAVKYGITLTGEGGELETLVTDAPFFRKIVALTSESVYANYNGRYCIQTAEVRDK